MSCLGSIVVSDKGVSCPLSSSMYIGDNVDGEEGSEISGAKRVEIAWSLVCR